MPMRLSQDGHRYTSRRKSGSGGFTLIELLTVVAVIAVLMAILMPALASARIQAKSVACLSNLRQIGVLSQMYRQDFNGGCMPAQMPAGTIGSYWFSYIGINFLHAPSGTKYYQSQGYKLFLCPADDLRYSMTTTQVSYGYLDQVLNGRKESQFRAASQVQVVDCDPSSANTSAAIGTANAVTALPRRHGRTTSWVNADYLDGHAERTWYDQFLLQVYPTIRYDGENNIMYWKQLN